MSPTVRGETNSRAVQDTNRATVRTPVALRLNGGCNGLRAMESAVAARSDRRVERATNRVATARTPVALRLNGGPNGPRASAPNGQRQNPNSRAAKIPTVDQCAHAGGVAVKRRSPTGRAHAQRPEAKRTRVPPKIPTVDQCAHAGGVAVKRRSPTGRALCTTARGKTNSRAAQDPNRGPVRARRWRCG